MEEFRPASLSPDSSSDESTLMPTPVAAEEGVEEEQVVDDNEEIDVSAEMRRLDELRSSPGEGNLPMRRRESPRLAKKREDIAASVAAAIKKSKRSNNPTNLKATTQAARATTQPARATTQPARTTQPAKTSTKTKGGNGGAGRSKGPTYKKGEVDFLLDLLEDLKPACSDEWDIVTQEYNKQFPGRERDRDSLRRKFNTLHNKKVPTGNPTMPEDVERAKMVIGLICAKVDAGGDVDEDDLGIEEDEEEEDEQPLRIPTNLFKTGGAEVTNITESSISTVRSLKSGRTPHRRSPKQEQAQEQKDLMTWLIMSMNKKQEKDDEDRKERAKEAQQNATMQQLLFQQMQQQATMAQQQATLAAQQRQQEQQQFMMFMAGMFGKNADNNHNSKKKRSREEEGENEHDDHGGHNDYQDHEEN